MYTVFHTDIYGQSHREKRQRGSGIFIVNFEHIPYHFVMLLLLTLNK